MIRSLTRYRQQRALVSVPVMAIHYDVQYSYVLVLSTVRYKYSTSTPYAVQVDYSYTVYGQADPVRLRLLVQFIINNKSNPEYSTVFYSDDLGSEVTGEVYL